MCWILRIPKILKQLRILLFPDLVAFYYRVPFRLSPGFFLWSSHMVTLRKTFSFILQYFPEKAYFMHYLYKFFPFQGWREKTKQLYIELRNKCFYIYYILSDCLKCNKYAINMRMGNDNLNCKSKIVFFCIKSEI